MDTILVLIINLINGYICYRIGLHFGKKIGYTNGKYETMSRCSNDLIEATRVLQFINRN